MMKRLESLTILTNEAWVWLKHDVGIIGLENCKREARVVAVWHGYSSFQVIVLQKNNAWNKRHKSGGRLFNMVTVQVQHKNKVEI